MNGKRKCRGISLERGWGGGEADAPDYQFWRGKNEKKKKKKRGFYKRERKEGGRHKMVSRGFSPSNSKKRKGKKNLLVSLI